MADTDKQAIIDRLIKNSAEVITEDELRERLESGVQLTHYIGFEISGYVHLGTGLMSALVMKDLTDLGVKCTVWLADWHTFINKKLDAKFETAQKIGRRYFAEALKASFKAVGGDPDKLDIRLASEEYYKIDDRKDFAWIPYHYWETVIRVSQNASTARIMRSLDIMGRQKGGEVDYARTMYPSMQVADVFFLEVDIAHAGMDQRKAHVVMRDVAKKVYADKSKPIALHHPLLIGLQQPPQWPIPSDKDEKDVILDMKMSKSDPASALWVHDDEKTIEEKIKKAFCPEKEVKYNPILNWVGHIFFWNRMQPFRIERKPEHGGDVEFKTYEELESAYAAGDVHPMDLKAAVAKELTELLAPVREHFAKPEIAAMKQELDDVLAKRG